MIIIQSTRVPYHLSLCNKKAKAIIQEKKTILFQSFLYSIKNSKMISAKHSVIHKYRENLIEKLNDINERLKRTPHISLGEKIHKNHLFFTKPVFSFFHQKGYEFRAYHKNMDQYYFDCKKEGVHIINPYFEKPYFVSQCKYLQLPEINLNDSLFQTNMDSDLKEEIFKTIEPPISAIDSCDLILEKNKKSIIEDFKQRIQFVKFEDLDHFSISVRMPGLLDVYTFSEIEKELLDYGYIINITDYFDGSIIKFQVDPKFISSYLYHDDI